MQIEVELKVAVPDLGSVEAGLWRPGGVGRRGQAGDRHVLPASRPGLRRHRRGPADSAASAAGVSLPTRAPNSTPPPRPGGSSTWPCPTTPPRRTAMPSCSTPSVSAARRRSASGVARRRWPGKAGRSRCRWTTWRGWGRSSSWNSLRRQRNSRGPAVPARPGRPAWAGRERAPQLPGAAAGPCPRAVQVGVGPAVPAAKQHKAGPSGLRRDGRHSRP